jgi:hypothetical protein
MRVAIVGSRDYPDLTEVHDFVATLPPGTVVVSGGARGVDRASIAAAKALGFAWQEFNADWKTLGRRAGYVRNREMIPTVGRVVCFWDGVSRGSADAVDVARKHGIEVEVRMPGSVSSEWTWAR